MRYFNTHGPVEIEEHYVVSRQWLVNQLSVQINQGKYFTIFAPRQMGKTTLLRKLNEMLMSNQVYIPIPISFERFESWSMSLFMQTFVTEGVERGYYVIFHARPNVYGKLSFDELEFETVQDEKQIQVYLVRLEL